MIENVGASLKKQKIFISQLICQSGKILYDYQKKRHSNVSMMLFMYLIGTSDHQDPSKVQRFKGILKLTRTFTYGLSGRNVTQHK